LNLYEPLDGTTAEQIGSEVVRTQWLGDAGKLLIGKRVLIVDEVDDTRKTLQYAASELQKDVDVELLSHPESEREALQTKFGVFVVHNKKKPKLGALPPDIPYFSAMEISDVWLDYPWEAIDIDEHDALAEADRAAHQ
jgi:hypoxanthine phosphoribosyltransferase